MELSSWEASSYSASREIPRLIFGRFIAMFTRARQVQGPL